MTKLSKTIGSLIVLVIAAVQQTKQGKVICYASYHVELVP